MGKNNVDAYTVLLGIVNIVISQRCEQARCETVLQKSVTSLIMGTVLWHHAHTRPVPKPTATNRPLPEPQELMQWGR